MSRLTKRIASGGGRIEDVDLLKSVADKIKDILENGRRSNGERVLPSDIAILLRSKDKTEDYITALKDRGVMSEFISEERFFERSEILLIMCLLNVIDSPTRDAYLAGALMSGVFGFSLEELVKIRKESNLSQTELAEKSGNKQRLFTAKSKKNGVSIFYCIHDCITLDDIILQIKTFK